MATIYITGDRAINPWISVNLAAQVVQLAIMEVRKENPEEVVSLVTGDSPTGIEGALKFLFENDSNFTIYPRSQNTEGKWDLDAHNQSLVSSVDKVYLLHSDPLNSSIAKSVMQTFPQEKVVMPLQDMQGAG